MLGGGAMLDSRTASAANGLAIGASPGDANRGLSQSDGGMQPTQAWIGAARSSGAFAGIAILCTAGVVS